MALTRLFIFIISIYDYQLCESVAKSSVNYTEKHQGAHILIVFMGTVFCQIYEFSYISARL